MAELHIDVHIHGYDSRQSTYSVTSWWPGPDGKNRTAVIASHDSIDAGGRVDPWSLLAAAYRELAEIRSAREGNSP